MDGTIGAPLELDVFTFAGERGDIVTITVVQTGATDAGFVVAGERFNPDGTPGGSLFAGTFNWALPATGSYVLRLRDNLNTRRGSYSIRQALLRGCPVESQPPGPPTNLTASVTGSTVALNWSAPATGGAVTSYVLEAGVSPGNSGLANFDTGSTQTSYTAFSVTQGTYFVRVKARNAAGTSAASNEVVILVASGCVVAPSPPTSLAATVNGQAVTLNWTSPGGPVTEYVIQAGSSLGASNIANFATGNATPSLMAIAAPGTYFVRISARNACGTSGPSNEVIVSVF